MALRWQMLASGYNITAPTYYKYNKPEVIVKVHDGAKKIKVPREKKNVNGERERVLSLLERVMTAVERLT